MAAPTVFAELKFRDGLREKISVKVENNLNSLIGAIHELNENVSRLLSELVEREKARGDCADGQDGERTPVDITVSFLTVYPVFFARPFF